MEFFASIDSIDPAVIHSKIDELRAFLEKPKLELRSLYNARLVKINDNFRGRKEALEKQGGAFQERRLKGLQLDYLIEVEKLVQEFQTKISAEA